MKIESRGFTITDIIPHVRRIETDGSDFRIGFKSSDGYENQTDYMSREEFLTFADAIDAARERLAESAPASPIAPHKGASAPIKGAGLYMLGKPMGYEDRSGDKWYWNRYGLLCICIADGDCATGDHGRTVESVRALYGPVTELEWPSRPR